MKIARKMIAVLLALTFVTGQCALAPAADALAPASINCGLAPERATAVKNSIAGTLEPGAIGNGSPLLDLAAGKLPDRIEPSDGISTRLAVLKIREAIDIAINMHIQNRGKIPAGHSARAEKALENLIALQDHLTSRLHLYNAIVDGPEDYLLGFNLESRTGLSIDCVNGLYAISPKQLAQYVYHECVPEKGMVTDRDDHRTVYREIQAAIFGTDEVSALGKNLRSLINRAAETAGKKTPPAAAEKPVAEDTAVSTISFDEFLIAVQAIFTDDQLKGDVVNVMYNGPASNGSKIAGLLESEPSVFAMDEAGLTRVKELSRILVKDTPESASLVAEINAKTGLELNRQQILAVLVFWATEEEVRLRVAGAFAAKKKAGASRPSVGAFTAEEQEAFLAEAREDLAAGRNEHALLYFSYAVGVAKETGISIADVKAEAVAAVRTVVDRALARSEPGDPQRKARIYNGIIDYLLNKGAADLADLAAADASVVCPEFVREFRGQREQVIGPLLTNERYRRPYHEKFWLEHQNVGEFRAAAFHTKMCVSFDPSSSSYYSNLAIALNLGGRREDAVKAIERAIELNPDETDAYNNLGRFYFERKLYADADNAYMRGMEVFERLGSEHPSLRDDPDYTGGFCRLLHNMGDLYMAQDRLEYAKILFETALSVKPDDSITQRELAELNARLARSGKPHDEAAMKDIHFVYGFTFTGPDAESQIRDVKAIMMRAREQGKRVKIIFPMDRMSLPLLKSYTRAKDNSDLFGYIENRALIGSILGRASELCREALEGIRQSHDEAGIRKILGDSAYSGRWAEFFVSEKPELYMDEHTVDTVINMLKAAYYQTLTHEALKGKAMDADINRLVEWKKKEVASAAMARRIKNGLACRQAARLKQEDRDSVVIVMGSFLDVGAERRMREDGYDVEFHFPFTSGFADVLVPEHQMVNAKAFQESDEITFSPEEESTLRRSIIANWIFTAMSSDSTYAREAVTRRIFDRISDADFIQMMRCLKRKEEEHLPLGYLIVKWLVLHAKITADERRYFSHIAGIDQISGFYSDDIVMLIEQLRHPDTAMAKQSAVMLGRMGVRNRQVTEIAVAAAGELVAEDMSEEERRNPDMARRLMLKYLAAPKTRNQYMAALIMQERGVIKDVEFDDRVLEGTVESLAVALSSGDETARREARRRIYRDGRVADIVETYLKEAPAKGGAAYLAAIKELKDRQAADMLIAALFADNEGEVVAAIEALGELGDELAVEPLLYTLSHDKKAIRDAAKEAILKIGPDALPIIEDRLARPAGSSLSGIADVMRSLAAEIRRLHADEIKKRELARQPVKVTRGPDEIAQGMNMEYRATLFKAGLLRVLAAHPDRKLILAIDTDIGESQKHQIMPIYTAIDQLKSLKDREGNPLLPNLVVLRGSGESGLTRQIDEAMGEGASRIKEEDVFVVARNSNVEKGLFDALKGKSWISAIDDTKSGNLNYLPVFETATLTIMAALNADTESIRRFYDSISSPGNPIRPEAFEEMLKTRVIYILPKASPIDTETLLRGLYEKAREIYLSA